MQKEVQQPAEVPLLDQFKSQMLKAWQPVPSLTKTIIMFFVLAAIFLGLGIPMLILSQNIIQSVQRYDNVCGNNTTCNISITVNSDMQSPVFIYYQLNNYFQNHRLYAKSVSVKQLLGYDVDDSDLETQCAPITTNKQIVEMTNSQKNYNGNATLNNDSIPIPCGIIAYTLFNDTFQLFYPNGSQVQISENGIAWPTDIGRYQITNPNNTWTDITSERFINWMRISAMPDFRKLWGRINNDIPAGTYKLQINNIYNLSQFNDAQKSFVISQSNFFGSKNDFLSYTYIGVGSVCMISAIAFLIKKLLKKK